MARNCELCRDTKAIGKYFTEPEEGCVSGWWRVCAYCAEMVEGQGFDVVRYRSRQNIANPNELTSTQKNCSHKWTKHSLITLEGGYDWMKCALCDCFGKRYGLGQYGVTELQSSRPISNY